MPGLYFVSKPNGRPCKPMVCTTMACTPMVCTPMVCTPIVYTPITFCGCTGGPQIVRILGHQEIVLLQKSY